MYARTDLIAERREMHTKTLSGAESFTKSFGEVDLECVEILTEEAADALNKPIGKYFTIEGRRFDLCADTEDYESAVIYALDSLLPDDREHIMVVGLGNGDITPDALGPLTAGRILATRHLDKSFKRSIGLEALKDVSVVIPGVLGKTGIEASELTFAAVKRILPSAVIVIDALAALDPNRLCKTVQLCDTGISPGSGVQNSRSAFDKNTFGIPVIAIGIPTVIDAEAYRFEKSNGTDCPKMMVTPKEIDLLIEKGAMILSSALNRFLQPSLDDKVLKSLTQ